MLRFKERCAKHLDAETLLRQHVVLHVGDGLAPLVGTVGARGFEGHVAHPAVGRSTMPVLHVRGDVHHVTGDDLAGLFAPFLIPALAVGDEQDLAAALGRMVDVPVVAAAGLEGDVGDELGLLWVGQRVQIRAAREVLRIGVVGGAGAEKGREGAERIAAGGLDYFGPGVPRFTSDFANTSDSITLSELKVKNRRADNEGLRRVEKKLQKRKSCAAPPFEFLASCYTSSMVSPGAMVPPSMTLQNTPSRGMMQSPIWW